MKTYNNESRTQLIPTDRSSILDNRLKSLLQQYTHRVTFCFLFCLIRLISANQFLKKVQMFNNNTKIQGTTIRTPCCKCVSMPLYERFCTWTPWGTYEVNVTFYSGSSTFESLLFIDLIYNAWFRIHDLTNCHCLVYHRKKYLIYIFIIFY